MGLRLDIETAILKVMYSKGNTSLAPKSTIIHYSTIWQNIDSFPKFSFSMT